MFSSFYSYGISAESAVVMEVRTGRILYSKNMTAKKPMASTTKIMTALLALENCPLDAVVKVPEEAVGIEGSSIYLRYGEELTMEDLLYGLMLRSGNDAATAIACHLGGSVEGFAKMMNERAKELGAINTNFENPHGLHSKNHYTTAYDLALITRKALMNENFRKIVSTKIWKANREGYNYFYNKNKTLYQYSGGDGVKTGYTQAAGRCLVTSATRNGMQVIAVVLNDYNWFDDCYKLMDEAFNNFELFKCVEKGTPVKRFEVLNGKKDFSYVVPREDIYVPVKPEEKEKIKIYYDLDTQIKAPIKKGMVLGKAKVYLDDKLLATTELISNEDVVEKTFLDTVKGLINGLFGN